MVYIMTANYVLQIEKLYQQEFINSVDSRERRENAEVVYSACVQPSSLINSSLTLILTASSFHPFVARPQ